MFGSARPITFVIVVMLALFLLGVAGYMAIEGYSPINALYMTAITLTTVGFAEVEPLSTMGKLFTILLLFLGVGTLAYSLGTIAEYVMAGNLSGRFHRRQMQAALAKLTDHTIICGYGRVGSSAAISLTQNGQDVLVIEQEPTQITEALEHGFLVVEKDATIDDVLREAGVDRAAGLLACTGSDNVNLFIVLSARALNPDIHIVARSIRHDTEAKMRRAGANRVVSPQHIGGQHMANIMIRPHVTDFFDVVTLDDGQELWIEEINIDPGSDLDGMTIGTADIRRKTGVTLVALSRATDAATVLPEATTELHTADSIIVLGTREQLAKLKEWTSGAVAVAP